MGVGGRKTKMASINPLTCSMGRLLRAAIYRRPGQLDTPTHIREY